MKMNLLTVYFFKIAFNDCRIIKEVYINAETIERFEPLNDFADYVNLGHSDPYPATDFLMVYTSDGEQYVAWWGDVENISNLAEITKSGHTGR